MKLVKEIEQESPKFKIKRQFATILLYIMHNNIYLILKKNYIYQKKKIKFAQIAQINKYVI